MYLINGCVFTRRSMASLARSLSTFSALCFPRLVTVLTTDSSLRLCEFRLSNYVDRYVTFSNLRICRVGLEAYFVPAVY